MGFFDWWAKLDEPWDFVVALIIALIFALLATGFLYWRMEIVGG